jgi:hypothetical protein
LATRLPASAGAVRPVRLEKDAPRHERALRGQPGRLSEQVEPHARDHGCRHAERRQGQRDRERRPDERHGEQKRGTQVGDETAPGTPLVSRSDRLGGDRLQAHRDPDRQDDGRVPQRATDAGAREVVHRQPPDDGGVDQPHGDEPELRDRNRHRQAEQDAQLRET